MSTLQGITQAAVRLNVKLAPEVEPQRSKDVLSSTPGLVSVIQTFPDEADEELSRLFVVEVDPSDLAVALRKLKENPGVEYAEQTASRKLIW